MKFSKKENTAINIISRTLTRNTINQTIVVYHPIWPTNITKNGHRHWNYSNIINKEVVYLKKKANTHTHTQ